MTESNAPKCPGYSVSGGGKSALTYNSYLRVNELKELQICQSNPPHHDEPLFIIIHQTYELWFKLILHELDVVISYLNKDKIRRATFFMRRVNAIMSLLVNQIHILETMSPMEFLGFRNNLNPASGFQSTQFREIEVAGGLRDERLLVHFKNEGEAFANIQKRMEQPSLGDVFYAFLRRHGFKLPVSEQKLAFDATEAQSAAAEKLQNDRLQEMRKIYERPEEYFDYHDFAETLVDFDEHLTLWRSHHVTVVERVIGFKTGTGGSEGVHYLRSTLNKRCFPDLWKLRTVIEYQELEF
ncbi:MAG TPA: tryptophan 2,3-dioxygenase family protein [Oculatellaceae cyanobacterium]